MLRARTACVLVGALLGGAACTEAGVPGVTGDLEPVGGGPAARTDSFVPSRRLRRLSSREYDDVVRDLLGDTTAPATQFTEDVYPNGYDNGSAGLAVQSDQALGYMQAAEALAATAVQVSLGALTGGCDAATSAPTACAESFLATFAPRAFRRPLTATEQQRLRDLFASQAATGGLAAGIQTMLEVILQSPQFLYREELGPMDATAASGAVQLTDYEWASELSFLLTGSIPDDALWGAVQGGRFATADDRQREALRLLQTPGARDAMRSFLHQWLTTNRLSTLSKDVTIYPQFGPGLASSMSGELDRFYDQSLWTGSGSLRALFTSSQSFVDGPLAAFYGVGAPDSGTWQAVTLDPSTRPGILSRPGFLAVHADSDSSGPIARGVFLLQSIFCSPPPPPPANVPPAPAPTDPSAQGLTTRERFAEHVSNPVCAACHTRIDGLGFGLEEFDGIGQYRTTDDGQPVDASGAITGTGEIDGPYDGVAELATKLAGSRTLADCYARQAYRYAMGQVEDPSDDLSWLTPSSSADAPMVDIFLALVASPAFSRRAFEPASAASASSPPSP